MFSAEISSLISTSTGFSGTIGVGEGVGSGV
jgi:hypothetical protein